MHWILIAIVAVVLLALAWQHPRVAFSLLGVMLAAAVLYLLQYSLLR